MKLSKRSLVAVVVAVMAVLALIGTGYAQGAVADQAKPVVPLAAATLEPIPWEAQTTLPVYIGAPAKAHPLAPPRVPQNPYMGPNPFSYVHNDPWMSDVYAIDGPLGREPEVLTTRMLEARRQPPDPGPSSPYEHQVFACSGDVFDSKGRLVLSCTGQMEWSLVLVDPVSLEVLTYMHLPLQLDPAKAMSSAYLYLNNLDQVVLPVVQSTLAGNYVAIWVVATVESAGQPSFKKIAEYDISDYVGQKDNLNGLLVDWQGRIWFVSRLAGTVGVLDPETKSVKTIQLEGAITNSFAMDKDAAYIVTTAKMYRVGTHPDGQPYIVWAEGYQNTNERKPGQLSAGTGTTPTVLGNGKYVAITDNAKQMHVVVYRTDAQLDPNEKRIVCEVPVFEEDKGADDNSLIGLGLSLVAYNCYGNELWEIWETTKTMPSEPGIARVDIYPNGKGCRRVWENDSVSLGDSAAKLSSRNGLVYAVTRKYDTQVPGYEPTGLDVYYLSAIDFRTGEVVWERLLGTGFYFDSFTNILLGPTGTAYFSPYGGLTAIRDTE